MSPLMRSLFAALSALILSATVFAQAPVASAPDPSTLSNSPGAINSSKGAPAQASVVVVIDSSGASSGSFSEMRAAASNFIRSMGEDRDVAVIAAANNSAMVADFNTEPDDVLKRLAQLKPKGTPAIQSALALATQHAAAESDNAAVVAFVRNSDPPALAAKQLAAYAKVPVYVIASPDSKWRVQSEMQEIAVKSGGTAFFPSNGRELRDVIKETATRVTGAPVLGGDTVPEKNLLRGYDRLIVKDIPMEETPATQEAAGGENLLMQQVLVARIRKAKLFPVVVNGADERSVESAESAPIGGALELHAVVTEFRRGNKMARQFLAGMKGGAKMKLRVILVDAATKKPILSFTKEANSASGLWGGTSEHVQAQSMLSVANEIVDELKRAR